MSTTSALRRSSGLPARILKTPLVLAVAVTVLYLNETISTTVLNKAYSHGLSQPSSLSKPLRPCVRNPFISSLSTTAANATGYMRSWLQTVTKRERDFVAAGQHHDHTRFRAFEQYSDCERACVGGICGEDESKIVCGLSQLRASCVVYSIGGNNLWAFEMDLLEKTSCDVHTFDCTGPIERFEVPKHPRLHFHHVCIAATSALSHTDPSMHGTQKTFEEILQNLGHRGIDLLKMDIEGYEWSLIYDWYEMNQLQRSNYPMPMQILVEVHYRTGMRDLAPTDKRDFKFATDMIQLQSSLLKMGYFTAVNAPNPHCQHCTELTLLRMLC